MQFSEDNFLVGVKGIVTGGGRDTAGNRKLASGFVKRVEGVTLNSIAPISDLTATAAALVDNTTGTATTTLEALTSGSVYATDVAAIRNNFADLASMVNKLTVDAAAIRVKLSLTTDETNARVIRVEETIDNIGSVVVVIPRDYDEATDYLVLRVLTSQATLSVDNDVQLDSEFYRKRAAVALSADLAPAAPATILSTTEQWIDFVYTGLAVRRDDVVTIKLITNGANDTDAEEVLIHGIELVYASTLVSYDEATSTNVQLR